MDKLKILYIQAQEGFGADAAIHAHLMRELPRDEFEVHVACPRARRGEKSQALLELEKIPDVRLHPVTFAPSVSRKSTVELLRTAAEGAAFPVDFARLRNDLARERFAVVHGSDRPRSGLYALGLARLAGAKSVVHVHVRWSNDYGLPSRLAVARADAVFSISRFVTDSIVATGKPAARVYTILNGIDVSRWDPDLDGSAVRRQWSIAPDALVLASVSRLFPGKGQRELLRALALVVREVSNVKLLVVGADESWIAFTAELRALALELGIAEHVIFTGPRSDIPAVMAAADVFTLPSFEEPFGLVYTEAMAMRRPVVALDNGGTPEVVEHGRTGLLSPAGDHHALAANILTLLKDPALRARMGAEGRARVLTRFSAERMARDAADAYRRIAGR
ncbi:MAG TPA: glycosyltransferase family 4 protein [Polyangiaceae bacterium]|nr:glycosyltransferase family 4 protein [Polyangiaceae bacterium]